jgi:multidrug efflux pump subunit AcrB
MFFFPGNDTQVIKAITIVVILVLAFSLIECLLILPHHLSTMKPEQEPKGRIGKAVIHFQRRFANALLWIARNKYRPLVERALKFRYTTSLAIFMAFFISLSLLFGGWVRMNFAPEFNLDFVQVRIQLHDGSSFEQLEGVLTQIEQGTDKLKKDFSDERPDLGGESLIGHYQGAVDGSRVRFWMELDNTDDMRMSMEDFVARWREAIGDIPDVLDFDIDYQANDGGNFIQIMLVSEDSDVLDRGVQLLRAQLAEYVGTYNISDLMRGGRPEFEISLKPEAETLSLSLADVARQVRQGFYGEEVQRIPRGRDDVRVMLRYPLEERRSVETLTDMRIRTPDGRQVPFSAVANVEFGKGYTYVRRQDRHRVNFVFANLSDDGATADEIVKDLKANHYPKWQKDMPDLKFELSGHLKEQQEFYDAFFRLGIFALLLIYTLMAVAFRSYTQPFIIMSAIPFGVMGAIFGHLIMGLDFALMSSFGIIAACGVVVNDNLVLVDYINRLRDEGMDIWDAIREGAQSRFRPIVLTSVTTFVGLFPIMLERGMQAAFLGQMVVALAFGVAFATVVTLVLVPCLVGIEEDIHVRFRRLWARIRGRDPVLEGTAAE